MSDIVSERALEHGLADADLLEVRDKVLRGLYTEWEFIDSGVGGGACDFWVRLRDVEYKLVLKPHRLLKKAS